MDQEHPWRVSVLGWGNLVLGIAIPTFAWINVLAALGVFSVQWAGEAMILTALLGSALGCLHLASGWTILKGRPAALGWSILAGGLTFGYTVLGILEMSTAGRDGLLLILIRHGSEDWWDWSFSHFQNSALREIPLMAWWVIGFGTLARYPVPGSPKMVWERLFRIGGWGFFLALFGAIARLFQLTVDTSLYSQR